MRARIQLYWLLFMGGLGAVFPFFGLYFRENAGLSGIEVGAVLAVLPVVGFAAQPLWGQVADLTGSRVKVLAWLSMAAGLCYLLVPLARGFVPNLAVMALVACFSTVLVPMATSVSLAALGQDGARQFGGLRVWGTIGFLIVVVSVPPVLDALEPILGVTASGEISEPLLGAIFAIAGVLWLVSGVVALGLPRAGDLELRAQRGEWRQLLRHRPYRRILFFGFGCWLCFQGPMVLFPIYVRSLGGDADLVSRLWIPMLALEIPLVAWSGAGLQRLGARGLLAIGIVAGAARWLLTALSSDPLILYPAQLLHGVVIAGVVVGAPLYVDESVPEQLRSTGQAVLAMLGFGVGGVLSNLTGGWLIDHFGPAYPALAGGLGGVGLACLLPFLLPPPRRPGQL
jgi:PPP family 3-phenylpropionic acid transporter